MNTQSQIKSSGKSGQTYSVQEYRALMAGQQLVSNSKPKRKTPEEDLHRMCFEWACLMSKTHPVLGWMVHVPNGGKRPHGEAGKLKALGVKPGFPDLVVPKKNLYWSGLAIELKSLVGKVSPEQKSWLTGFEEEGYLCAVCRDFSEFEVAVKKYLGISR
jgi:hypothetical protein